MFAKSFIVAAAMIVPAILACPQHNNWEHAPHYKRETNNTANNNAVNKTAPVRDWAYEASYNWGRVNPAYDLCQSGTQQSPIALSLSNGLSLSHIPRFNYSGSYQGSFYNWNYGPAFTVAHDGDWTKHPSFTYDNQTLYLGGWHIHAPADHSVGGDRSKAELHFVHYDNRGIERAVLAFRLDPGNRNATFFDQLPSMIGFRETSMRRNISLDLGLALDAVQHFNEFWTYQGSLTSPPCTEGIRWFVARQIMFTGVEQMRAILSASTYSARAEQEVWQHRINE
ncbi:carbonic anhydrase [Dissoconium aciculare CBS 342.82]|uniref:Carbonic anhydrase n=1 Tax=Dissoconium aciculare CBS 342.82 TaxID=1314786 RepID=A0A6J3M3U7_9PEZI|nr:carbonic anhydrase [Dissoconium aciculare CBS 342.82]KAF1822711.1 carbonic anhydrase [Dissoconium aciculare CBS 342.82]